MATVAEEAKAVQESKEDSGDALSKEEAAKKAWLARLDLPTWGAAQDVVATVAKMSEEEAKKAWLARLDVPSWGAAKAVVSTVFAMSEEEAWLARLDQPSWGPSA